MDLLPHEIIDLILSYLDDKNARIARLVSTDWFRRINYSKFVIYFASSALLPQIVDRLSKYQHPIELTLLKSVHFTDSDILEHIPRLTQLKAFALYDNSSSSRKRKLEPEEYLKLSTLTNLETLYIGPDRVLPFKLLQHFPRMKHCDSPLDTEETDEFVQYIATHCPHYDTFYTTDTALSLLPVSVTELSLHLITDQPLNELSRLTRLKRLTLPCVEERLVDLRHITWLESLTTDTADVTGLECSRQLTELFVQSNVQTGVSALLDSLATLPKVQKLGLYAVDNVALPSLSQLTSLWITAKSADVAPFPTSLQDLSLNLSKDTPFELSALSHLVHLTQLQAALCSTTAIEPLNGLTNLMELSLSMQNNERISSLSGLHTLTSLVLKGEINPKTITCLTNLGALEFDRSPLNQETSENLQYLTNLTSLVIKNPVPTTDIFDCTILAKLPLVRLCTVKLDLKNYWAVLSTLTTLESLTIGPSLVEAEEDVLLLTSLSNLTQLRVYKPANNVTCVHITALTTLQDLSLYFSHGFTFSELSLKLTRLLYAYI